jgi:hypothetical protein
MKSLGCLTAILIAAGPVVVVAGLLYAMAMGAGIPTQDATPERQAYEALHNKIAGIIMSVGLMTHLAGWIVGIVALIRSWLCRNDAMKGFEVTQ